MACFHCQNSNAHTQFWWGRSKLYEVGQLVYEVGQLLDGVGQLVYEVGQLLDEVVPLLYEVGQLPYEVGQLLDEVSLVPRLFGGGDKRAWYLLFAHALN